MTEGKKKSGGGAAKWVIGCLVGLVAVAVLCGGGAWVFWGVAVDRISSLVLDEMVAELERSGIPQEETDDIRSHLERLKDGVLDGGVAGEDLERVAEEFAEGPLLPMGISFGFESYALANPGLSAEEREAGKQDIRRFRKGLWEERIDTRSALEVFETVQVGGEVAKGNWDDVEEVRGIASEIRRLADDAGVQDTDFDFDVSDEVGRMVNELLGE
jgi:hypothetical protein